jgi:hypothetical protein
MMEQPVEERGGEWAIWPCARRPDPAVLAQAGFLGQKVVDRLDAIDFALLDTTQRRLEAHLVGFWAIVGSDRCEEARSPRAATSPPRRRGASPAWPSTRKPASGSRTWSAASGSIASCANSAPVSKLASRASSAAMVWRAVPGAAMITSRPRLVLGRGLQGRTQGTPPPVQSCNLGLSNGISPKLDGDLKIKIVYD